METPKKVLITGATGFIGRNLIGALSGIPGYELLTANSKTTEADLVEKVVAADFIAHLGGVTRTTDESQFHTGNSVLTDKIISTLEEHGKRTSIIFTSSIHADIDNAYGKSKRFSEQRILSYGKEKDVPVYVFRLTNTFGKLARPNYHSVVATFCYNIAHDLGIQISDPVKQMNLLYIDDLISCLVDIIQGKESDLLVKHGDFYSINKTHSITLGELADIIRACKDAEAAPGDEFGQRIYQTFLSYKEHTP